MDSQTKTCQNCKSSFVIEQEDFAFYGNIKVPPPTWCPDCRLKRRMVFVNERSLHRRGCDLCNKQVISIFPENAGRPVYCQPCWWSDKWDPLMYGKEIDFSRPFFEQLNELFRSVPDFGPQTMHSTLVNSDYCNIGSYLKNCYLLFNSDYDEDCAYSTVLERSKNCLDLYISDLCEFCYMSTNLFKCFRTFFSNNCNECVDVWFSKNLRGCSNCLGCINLRNKQYYIFNQPYTKEEYSNKIAEWNTDSYKTIQQLARRAREVHIGYPRKFMEGLQNANVSGDYIFNSKNVFSSYEVGGAEDSKYCHFLFINGTKDSYDFTMWGAKALRIYECMGSGNNQNDVKFCYDTWSDAFNLQYCWHILARNSDLFGCMALRNKQYCILNKQYTKEEYEGLVPKIVAHMNAMPYIDRQGKTYKYGEFFPPEMSAYTYNETIAQKYFPLTKKEAVARGYKWRDSEKKDYNIQHNAADLPDDIKDVSDSTLEETIGCEHGGSCNEQCTTAFKFTKEELAFYRKLKLPLPRSCYNCRHYYLLRQRNPIKFYDRACQCEGAKSANGAYVNTTSHFHESVRCPHAFRTTYSPDQSEIVYCEQCYQAEVA